MTAVRTKRTHKHGNRRALVTGASSGIGEAFADRLARDQYDLIVVARRRDRLDALAERLHAAHHVKVDVVVADLTRAAQLQRVEERLKEDEIDLLVNNAGFGSAGRFADLDIEVEQEEVQLNVLALVRLTRAALPGMIERGHGGIINVSSMAGFQPGPYMATYGATKAYVNSFTEALYEELRGTGVSVQALCPGFTRTEFQARAGVDASDTVPSFAWMTAEAVVDESLAALARGQVLCVPGFGNRVMTAFTSTVPRSALRRVMATVMRRGIARK